MITCFTLPLQKHRFYIPIAALLFTLCVVWLPKENGAVQNQRVAIPQPIVTTTTCFIASTLYTATLSTKRWPITPLMVLPTSPKNSYPVKCTGYINGVIAPLFYVGTPLICIITYSRAVKPTTPLVKLTSMLVALSYNLVRLQNNFVTIHCHSPPKYNK